MSARTHQHADVVGVEIRADSDSSKATGAEAGGDGTTRGHPLPSKASHLRLKGGTGAACSGRVRVSVRIKTVAAPKTLSLS